MPKILILGCGFVGEAAADLFLSDGWEVVALTRSPDSAAALQQRHGAAGQGWSARSGDATAPECLARIARGVGSGVTAAIHCASARGGGPDAYRSVYLQGMRHLAAAFPGVPLLFTGSTSVYAQTDGGRVDESSPAEPERETGRILLEAEAVALASGGWVARLAGIYGPGRCAHLRKMRDGTARLEDGGHRWLNQIHRDDAAAALHHLVGQRCIPGIYNVCDDSPMQQRDLYTEIARRLGLPPPPPGPADRNRKRGWTSKRVSNAKLRATGWAPRCPAFTDALEGS